MRALFAVVCLGLAAAPRPTPAAEAGLPVDAELVLAVDVSRSMTPRELEIQRRGYAEALASEEVIATIEAGYHGRVAIAYMEWAGSDSQRLVVDWTLVANRADAEALAAKLTAHFDSSMRRTSISGALDRAATLFDGNGFTAHRQVIDVSGDGPNNNGRPVLHARDQALARGVAINGLPLMTDEGMGAQWHLPDLDRYYFHCVIGGPGAFVVPVHSWDEFPDAVRRKLILELSWTPPAAPEPTIQPATAVEADDCLIVEHIWERMWGDMN
ncbi:MAG: DUF1194 domain-containing protein [Bauldia litoralis]